MNKKKIIVPLLLVILVGAGLFYWQFSASKNSLSESEKAKAYQNILGHDVKEEKVIEINNYQGKNFSLKYPSNFRVKEATDSANGGEVLRLISTEPRVNLTVMAVDAAATDLKDYAAVKLRSEGATPYKKSEVQLNNLNALIFDKTASGDNEKTLFIKKGDKIISLSLTGSNQDTIQKTYEQVSKTFSF